jgi:hypothetical protein
MGLQEHAIDLLEIDEASLIANGLEQRTDAEVAGATQEALAGTDDQVQGLGGEGVVSQAGAVHLGQEELFDGFGRQTRENDRVGDAGTDLLVDGQGQGLDELGLADEDEVVRGGGKTVGRNSRSFAFIRG